MAVTIDIGEWNDILPIHKENVGKRLALTAQRRAYGDTNVVHSGPIYKSMEMNGNKMIISFTDVGSGLFVRGSGELNCYSIAGTDKEFIGVKAKIQGNMVVVWNDSIGQPVAVRYAWADNPDESNLYNSERLPASPF